MKKIILLFLLFSVNQLFAQKVSFNDGIVTVDEKPFMQIEIDGCKAFSPQCVHKVKNNAGKLLIIVTNAVIYMPERKEASNPQGRISYSRIVFLDSLGQKCEIEKLYMKTENLAKFIVKNGFIKDDILDAEAVRAFVLSNGTPFSDRNGR